MENYNNENDLSQQENDLSQTGSSLEQITEQNNVTEQSAHSDNDFEDPFEMSIIEEKSLIDRHLGRL